MAGANIFIMYAASDSNITLSPRSGEGGFQPLFNSAARITLLEGTGISNGVMTANVRCDDCLQWDGGSMDPTDTSAPWIWSVKHGSPIDSTSTSQNLIMHDIMGTFTFDLSKATGGSSQNPLDESESSPTSSGASPSATSPSGSSGYGSGSSSTFTGPSVSSIDSRRKAHGAVMTVSFAVLLPMAALSLHLPLKVAIVPFIHAPIELLSLCLIITGMGIGISLAKDLYYLKNPVQPHVVIGLLVVSTLVLFQPAMGLLQHLHYRKTGGKSIFAFLHRWLGRAMIILGMINGGLGFQLAGIGTILAPNKCIIAYSVVAGVVSIVYLFTVLYTTASDIRGGGSGAPTRGGEKVGMQNLDSSGKKERDQRDVLSTESGGALMDGGRYS
jgi:hypothetical protein